jgi:hypothetical protein
MTSLAGVSTAPLRLPVLTGGGPAWPSSAGTGEPAGQGEGRRSVPSPDRPRFQRRSRSSPPTAAATPIAPSTIPILPITRSRPVGSRLAMLAPLAISNRAVSASQGQLLAASYRWRCRATRDPDGGPASTRRHRRRLQANARRATSPTSQATPGPSLHSASFRLSGTAPGRWLAAGVATSATGHRPAPSSRPPARSSADQLLVPSARGRQPAARSPRRPAPGHRPSPGRAGHAPALVREHGGAPGTARSRVPRAVHVAVAAPDRCLAPERDQGRDRRQGQKQHHHAEGSAQAVGGGQGNAQPAGHRQPHAHGPHQQRPAPSRTTPAVSSKRFGHRPSMRCQRRRCEGRRLATAGPVGGWRVAHCGGSGAGTGLACGAARGNPAPARGPAGCLPVGLPPGRRPRQDIPCRFGVKRRRWRRGVTTRLLRCSGCGS